MATVIAAAPLDMMAPHVWNGSAVAATPTQIVLETDEGLTTRFEGDFQYAGSQGVTGGTLTGVSQANADGAVFGVIGLSLSASDLYGLIQSGDETAVWQIALAGDDTLYGSSGDDVLLGFDGNDTFFPGSGSDTVWGGNGSDTLEYRGGSDTFFGDTGFDIVHFNLDQTQADINAVSDGSFQIGLNGSADQVTTQDVERLVFNNHDVVALDVDAGENGGMAFRMYEAALNREPDQNGLAEWINYLDHGGSTHDMANMFIGSQEFMTLYGNLDNASFVEQLYNNILDREGEPEGVAAWTAALDRGTSRADVLIGFSESPENIAQTAPQLVNGISYNEWWAA